MKIPGFTAEPCSIRANRLHIRYLPTITLILASSLAER